jgi:hypothetical protein
MVRLGSLWSYLTRQNVSDECLKRSNQLLTALKMKTVIFSEALVNTYWATWRRNPENHPRRVQRRENHT